MSPLLYTWIAQTLVNDEASTDAELVAHFQSEGPMSEEFARFFVAQRPAALLNGLTFRLAPIADRKKHSHRCQRCRQAHYCYRKHCTYPQKISACQYCK